MTPSQHRAQRILQAISEAANDMSVDRISSDMQLERDIGIDSLSRIDLFYQLENEFDIVLSEAAEGVVQNPKSTVADVMAAVQGNFPSGEPS